MTIADRIKEARKAAGLTQKELGERMGVSDASIAQYESGQRNPKIETLDRIAAALNIPIFRLNPSMPWSEYQSTEEYKRVERAGNAVSGVIAILAEIYGCVEHKEVRGDFAHSAYYLVGKGDNQFVLHDLHIDALHASISASIPPIVDQIKDTRPESVIISEMETDLNSEDAMQIYQKVRAEHAARWGLSVDDLA